ncbi:NepR family anti-sigma factor [Methylobacterium sp. NEAU 140]|uniref:NepR family anti-sigma factor n=1 Tax=Methylobacterium sp. NEAU 140 TaxID=3064945 RepID=UPI0027335EDB|nr:NepR family anti-sigma factor [Methylobacterium sp. NEAU 140]MDP4024146.1 NepR family anti-sigma factor [Methylobacterium sp. NEAU 140]
MAKNPDAAEEQDRAGQDAAVAAPAGPARRPLDAAARARIGRGLRLHYASVLALPVPDHLKALLDDLAATTDREAPR